MDRDEIRARFSETIYTAPHADRLSQNDIASIAAHLLPAIAEYFATLIEDQHPEAADTIRNT